MNMPDSTQIKPTSPAFSQPHPPELNKTLSSKPLAEQPFAERSFAEISTLELAQALAERLAIAPNDWHRLKSNRKARAGEQAAMSLVYLLSDQPEEALMRLQQATGWLDRSISAPPCPTHDSH